MGMSKFTAIKLLEGEKEPIWIAVDNCDNVMKDDTRVYCSCGEDINPDRSDCEESDDDIIVKYECDCGNKMTFLVEEKHQIFSSDGFRDDM
jgi:hypothetical protein